VSSQVAPAFGRGHLLARPRSSGASYLLSSWAEIVPLISWFDGEAATAECRMASGVAGSVREESGLVPNRGRTVLPMERVEGTRRYDVPVERGFRFITDTANWSKFWPGFVRLAENSRWGTSGDTARLVTRLLGRERELTMTITAFEPNQLVTYTSTQPGLPNARHERHFEPDGEGFVYRLVVEYEPRTGMRGVADRLILPRGIRRAFESTFEALDREFSA
jgi:uncharacterized protein YndB with AHSA1/START domain